MPRRVDHAERRQEIVDAVCRIVLNGGLPNVTFRQVAAEAGISVRLVQYYFGSKDQLLLAVQLHVAQRSTERLIAMVEETDGSAKAGLRAILRSFIPTDDESRVAMLIYASLHTAWVVDPTSAPADAFDVPRLGHATIVEHLNRGSLVDDIDVDLEATNLMSLVTAHALYVLDGMNSAEYVMAAIDYQLDRIFS